MPERDPGKEEYSRNEQDDGDNEDKQQGTSELPLEERAALRFFSDGSIGQSQAQVHDDGVGA
jgi:hypothetical protein